MGDFFICANELDDKLARAAPLRVFDVRRHQALEAGARLIPGARWRDHMKTAEWAGQLAAGTEVVVNCMHGHNVSQMAAARLRAAGVNARVLAGGIAGWLEDGRPSVGLSRPAAADAGAPSVWVMPLGAGADALACAWLIERFIDPAVVVHFVAAEWVLAVADELGAVALGVAGGAIEPAGDLCFFDTILQFFDIRDPALPLLAPMVRGAAKGEHGLAPEVAGLAAVLAGAAARAGDDLQAVQESLPVYDGLYRHLRLEAGDSTRGTHS